MRVSLYWFVLWGDEALHSSLPRTRGAGYSFSLRETQHEACDCKRASLHVGTVRYFISERKDSDFLRFDQRIDKTSAVMRQRLFILPHQRDKMRIYPLVNVQKYHS